jgi:hypothetical protein
VGVLRCQENKFIKYASIAGLKDLWAFLLNTTGITENAVVYAEIRGNEAVFVLNWNTHTYTQSSMNF